jgi:uncharacterized protein (DUF697 family)/predicted GTPase
MFGKLFQRVRGLFSRTDRDAQLRDALDSLRKRVPVPVFWLFGKTQSGKTSLIKYLTGADAAEIGRGFQPCTRFSRRYEFPTAEAPLLSFLDTRGLDEPGYDPAEDLARFNDEAHVVVVTVKALDHAQENVLRHLRTIRKAQPARPVVLVLTCLHEAYPQQQHPQAYPFAANAEPAPDANLAADLVRSLAEQRRRFEELTDRVVAVDLTPPEEGFTAPDYGGPQLRQVLIEALPAALAQTLRTLEEAQRDLQDRFAREALPYILGYSTMAATAGALPVPFVDLLLLSAIQTGMLYDLARLYGQPMTARRLGEVASTLGLGILARQASRALIKVIPGLGTLLGSVTGGALAGASTFALGKAFCFYYRAVLEGHMPDPEELRRYYREQLALAQKAWSGKQPAVSDQQPVISQKPPGTNEQPKA